MTEDTRFELGSITKTVTGLLLAEAVERGEVALDDPLGRHLAELAGTPIGEVTLRELATHEGGLPAVFAEPGEMFALTTESLGGRAPSLYRDETSASLIARAAAATAGPHSRRHASSPRSA